MSWWRRDHMRGCMEKNSTLNSVSESLLSKTVLHVYKNNCYYYTHCLDIITSRIPWSPYKTMWQYDHEGRIPHGCMSWILIYFCIFLCWLVPQNTQTTSYFTQNTKIHMRLDYCQDSMSSLCEHFHTTKLYWPTKFCAGPFILCFKCPCWLIAS